MLLARLPVQRHPLILWTVLRHPLILWTVLTHPLILWTVLRHHQIMDSPEAPFKKLGQSQVR
ncbi:unnamed protein product [Staurois parvus]|uniref:Uncharacterized protein n=1 Tax=Staurois parvus TaxID=386267 RepID=A0ABN9AIW3_9NEOB|nr:unnamed protein product [Staurois parvus]